MQVSACLKRLIDTNINKLALQPHMYPFSTQALDYVLKIQERVDQNYRVLFEIIGELIFVLLVLHTKPDIAKARFRHQVIRGLS
ncbi:hypothetical protein [uncultured Paraglaciecola sp.]|uniref:hypothetical protein n=1 Tax=uncultured Paraglaciecola sp. TaxID=1765024 RepID=UPI0026373AB4|nr:hypothetical protein [uncultured Paraglaciecola sp.]